MKRSRQSEQRVGWLSGFRSGTWLLLLICSQSPVNAEQLFELTPGQSLFKLNATKFANGTLSTLTEQGVQAYLSKDYVEAEQLFSSALEKARQQNLNDGRMAKILTNLGSVYREQHRYTDAENAFKDALAVAKSNMSSDRASLNYVVKQYSGLLRKTDRTFEAGQLEEAAQNSFRATAQIAYADTQPIENDPFFARAHGENLAFLSRRFQWTADNTIADRYRRRYQDEIALEQYPVIAVESARLGTPDERAILPGVVPVRCACHHNGQAVLPPQMMPDYQVMELIRLRRQQAFAMMRQAGISHPRPHHGRRPCGRAF